MPRARNIKPGFFKNEALADCDPLARILFAGLWCLADREGRLEYRPKRIKAELLPYDSVDIEKLLEQLASARVIVFYAVEMPECTRAIQIVTFLKHQNPHKNEPPSKIPAYSERVDSKEVTNTRDFTGALGEDSGTCTNPIRRIPDSGILNSCNPGLGETDPKCKFSEEEIARAVSAFRKLNPATNQDRQLLAQAAILAGTTYSDDWFYSAIEGVRLIEPASRFAYLTQSLANGANGDQVKFSAAREATAVPKEFYSAIDSHLKGISSNGSEKRDDS